MSSNLHACQQNCGRYIRSGICITKYLHVLNLRKEFKRCKRTQIQQRCHPLPNSGNGKRRLSSHVSGQFGGHNGKKQLSCSHHTLQVLVLGLNLTLGVVFVAQRSVFQNSLLINKKEQIINVRVVVSIRGV